MARFRNTEQIITEAIKRGKFDNLSGKGKPLNLDRGTKPRDLPKTAEQQLVEAIERGDFDDIPGKGEPLDLDSYFRTPPHLRLPHQILKNAGYLPASLQLRKEIESLKEKRKATRDEEEKQRLSREINAKSVAYDVANAENRLPPATGKKRR